MSDGRAAAEALAAERYRARVAKDYARADQLRERITGLGFDVVDSRQGFKLLERPLFQRIDPDRIPTQPISLDASVHVLHEGFRDDLERFLLGLRRSGGSVEVVITDNASEDGVWLEGFTDERTRVLHMAREVGFGEARNAAARNSRGAVVVFADLSVEPTGDVVTPLVSAAGDPRTGICGPWGLVTSDLREFEETEGPAVDAIEGYLLAMRRGVFLETMFDPWFRWYRHADLDLSFRIRALGLDARVVPVPAARHEHRGWNAVPEPERNAMSKRNFNRFLDHWRDRTDLLVGRRA